VALELAGDRIRETDVTLTPVHEGRFEVYINGEKVYDRKAEGAPDWVPFHRAMVKVKDQLKGAIEAQGVPAGAH
jgi:predicted Rdx family selenoprotein